jgi:hypothetical protein
MRYLNPADVEFGRGSWRDDRFDIWADEDDA